MWHTNYLNCSVFFQILKFLKLIMDIYKNSSTQEKILNFHNTPDLKILISTIRLTTTISKNSVNVSISILLFLYFRFIYRH